MSILPLATARVSNLLRADVSQAAITSVQGQLLDVQNQISTGKRVTQPSDDPGAAAVIQTLQKTLDTRKAYAGNLTQANNQLSDVDSTLSTVNDLLLQAQNIASANVGSDVTADQRTAAAEIVQSIQSQMLSLANTQSQGVYLFAGDHTTTPPFVDGPAGVQYVGSSNVLQNAVDDGAQSPIVGNGPAVFGALSSAVHGTADLTPAVTADTRLLDLRGATGGGVHLGTIRVGDGVNSTTIDLSHADTLGDVVSALNSGLTAAGLTDVTASLSGQGLRLDTGAGASLSISAPAGSTTASDLGIATGNSPAASVAGQPLEANVNELTRLADLRGGAGIDTSHGLVITNGAKTATIDLSSAQTVGDLLNAVNGAGVGVQARVNAAGTGIDILNPTQGTQVSVGENGGTTAADLGVRTFSPTTALASLNDGKGVNDVAGNDFQITGSDGVTFAVDVAGAKTVQAVLDRINAAGGGAVTASFATTGNGIVLSDTAGGGGALTVAPLGGSTAAADLGLTSPVAQGAGATVVGGDVNQAKASGVFANLQKLTQALRASDQSGITAAAEGLKTDASRVVTSRGMNGAQVQEIQARQNRLDDENVSTKTLMSSLQDTDMTSAISQFTQLQTALQASLETSAKTLHMSLLDFLT